MVDAELKALAHPARRELVALCAEQERTAGELAKLVQLRQPTTSQHLKVLREAGLLTMRAEANRRLYRVDFERLSQVRKVLDAFWSDRLVALKRAAEGRKKKRK